MRSPSRSARRRSRSRCATGSDRSGQVERERRAEARRALPPRDAVAARAADRIVAAPEDGSAPARSGLLDREALARRPLAERPHADAVALEVLRRERQPEGVHAAALEDPVADVATRAAVALRARVLRGLGR